MGIQINCSKVYIIRVVQDYSADQGPCKTHIVTIVQPQGSCNIVQTQGSCYFNLTS